MVLIGSARIPENKRVFIALTYIYGIGRSLAQKIVTDAKVENKKVSQLTDEELERIVRGVEIYTIEDKLREEVQKKRNEKIRIGTYQGKRLEKGLPLKQRTHSNARTAKRLRRGGSKSVKVEMLKRGKQGKKTVKGRSK